MIERNALTTCQSISLVIEKKYSFSRYFPLLVTHFVHLSGSFLMLVSKISLGNSESHVRRNFSTSSSMLKILPPRVSFSSPNMW